MAKRLSIILLAIIGVITGAYAADKAKAVAYQYWVDTNFGARVTENIVDNNRVVTIPESYFSGLPNGMHTFHSRAKDANGVWGRIYSYSFYFFTPAAKDDSTYTALKAYRYAVNDGEVRNVSITPSNSYSERLSVKAPSALTLPISYNDGWTSFTIDSSDDNKVTMTRTLWHDIVMQFQNESGVWSDLARCQSDDYQTLTKTAQTVNIGGSVDFAEKPTGGTFEVVKFVVDTEDDYGIRTSEGCEALLIDSYSYTYSGLISAGQMKESYRNYLSENTYYVILFNAQKNMANPAAGLTLTLQSICKKPEISFDAETFNITMSSATNGATIYYTTDGSNPTEKSIKYDGVFKAPHNGWIKAIAVKDGYGISYIDSVQVWGMQAATPVASFEHPTLTLSCETPGATIYYSVGSTWYDDYRRYIGPVTLEDNSTVYFKASAPDFDESSRGEYTPSTFICADPKFEFNGRYLKMTSSPGSVIYYTIGDDTYLNSRVSGDSIEVSDTITVSAYAQHSRLGKSQTVEYKVPAVFNNDVAIVRDAGNLATALQWCKAEKYIVKTMRVKGNVNASDLAVIKQQDKLVQLDMSEAVVAEETLPDEAFAGLADLLSFVSPANLTSAGARLLSGCNSLGGIDWRSSCNVPEDILGGMEYANLILFVDNEPQASKTICKNIVVNGTISNITLVDAEERAGFFAPRSFYLSGTMSYTRSFTQPTLLTGECQGWEAICLPFHPTVYKTDKNQSCTPFNIWSEDSNLKPFWLYGFEYSGFISTWHMMYCMPRIISMPNNDQYADDYILGGDMTFSTSDTNIEATTLAYSENNGYRFVSNFTNKAADESRAVINSYEEYNGYKMGSVFVPGLRGAKAFEPYFEDATVSANFAPKRAPMVGVDNSSTGIEVVPVRLTDNDVYSENGIIYINSNCRREVKIYNAAGQLVRKVKLNEGVNQVTGLAKGVYVVNRVKIINR